MEAEVFVEDGYVAMIVPMETAMIIRKFLGMQAAGGSKWYKPLLVALRHAGVERKGDFEDDRGSLISYMRYIEEK